MQTFPLTANHSQPRPVSCIHPTSPWRAGAARAGCSPGDVVPASAGGGSYTVHPFKDCPSIISDCQQHLSLKLRIALCRARARGSSQSPPDANIPSLFGWVRDFCSNSLLLRVLPAPGNHPTTLRPGQQGRAGSNAETPRAAALPAEPSQKTQTRPALNPPSLVQIPGRTSGGFSCLPARVGLSGRRSPGLAGEQKPFNPQKSGDIFAKLCHGVEQVWTVAHGHKENQPPRAGGDRRAVKRSRQLQAGECLPCRTVTSFLIAKASPAASGTAVESYELLLRRSFVVRSLHR